MLGRAFHIARISGIPLLVHWTFGFFFIWIAFVGYKAGMDQDGIIRLCLFATVLFACVVMHEFGHALTARRFGIKTKDIIISPIGGIARLISMPKRPIQELVIAIAGPAVNFVIATVLGMVLILFTSRGVIPVGEPARIFNDPQNFFPALFWVNVLLILFNLVPAFPMDGGRILRALLSIRLGRTRATKIAARLGQLLAIAFLLYALKELDLILAFIGIFVFMSAAQEYRNVYMDAMLSNAKVADIYRSEFTLLKLNDEMGRAISASGSGKENNFIVIDESQNVKGVLPEEAIQDAIRKSDYRAPVRDYLSFRFESVPAELSLRTLLALFQQKGYSIIPVIDIEQMVGVVDRVTLNTYLQSKASFWKNWRKS